MTRRGRNWEADRVRRAMRRQGTESKHDEVPFMAPLTGKPRPPPPPTKAEQRAEAAKAFLTWRARRAAKPQE
jgi:hypothetical protein